VDILDTIILEDEIPSEDYEERGLFHLDGTPVEDEEEI